MDQIITTIKCTRCKLDREPDQFVRNNRIYLTCNQCSENSKIYYIEKQNNKLNNIETFKNRRSEGNNRKYSPQESTARRIWQSNHYKKLGLSFELFFKLSQQNCFYCGVAPLKKVNYFESQKQLGLKVSEYGLMNGDFYYNGIDKMIPEDSYREENLVTCCHICQFMKCSLTIDQFINQCNKISLYLNGDK